MLSKEYKEAVMKKLDNLTDEEFVSLLERAGSKRVVSSNKKEYKGDYHFNQYSGEPWYYK